LDFGRRLWAWVLSVSPATLFLCLGEKAAKGIAGLIGGEFERCYPAGWGAVTIGRYVGADGRVAVRLPHLSRYRLFGRPDGLSATAAASLRTACRLAS
jgi:hypothetical protein